MQSKIKIKTANEIVNFVKVLGERIKADVDLKKDRYVVDAKSVLSVIPFVNQEIILEIHSNDKAEVDEFRMIIQNYVIGVDLIDGI